MESGIDQFSMEDLFQTGMVSHSKEKRLVSPAVSCTEQTFVYSGCFKFDMNVKAGSWTRTIEWPS